MRCPKCHNENKIDALTCDFCMTELPMTEERKKQISELRKKERQSKERRIWRMFKICRLQRKRWIKGKNRNKSEKDR